MGLLTLLLVTMLGCSSPTPSPSPTPMPSPVPTVLYAPEDLVSVIPRFVGTYEVASIYEVPLDVDEMDGQSRGILRALLLQLGKQPGEIRQAQGTVGKRSRAPTEDPNAMYLSATRVEGIDAVALWEAWLAAAHSSDSRVDTAYEWHDIAGRRVMVGSTLSGETVFGYPKGEVLFMVNVVDEGHAPPIYDTLAALP